MIARKKSSITSAYNPLCADLHFVLEMESDSSLDSFINFLMDTVYALRIRRDGQYLERHNDLDKIPSFKFSKYINDSFSSLQDISDYFHEHYPLNFEEGYAAIASSPKGSTRKYVALSLPHLFADGKYLTNLTDNFLNNNPKENNLNNLPDFPYEKYVEFKDYFAKGPSNIKNDVHDDKLTRFFSNDTENIVGGEYDQYITLHFKAEELKNKSIQSNRVSISNFTEALYMSNYFAICAHENKLLKSYGVINVIDLKQYLPRPITFADGSEISFVAPYTENITPEMSIIDVGKNIRKSLIQKLNNNEQFSTLNSREYNTSLPRLNGIVTEFSNVGGFHIKKPIKNLAMSMFIKSMDRETCSNMGFSVIRDDFESYSKEDRETTSQNDMVIRYRYSPRKLSMKESTKIAKTIGYFLKNISLNDQVGNAFDEIKQFYNSL